MNIQDFVQNLDTPVEPYHGYCSSYYNNFFKECGLEEYDFPYALSDHGFTCHPIKTWICTDTEVGYYAIFHEEKLICLSYQPARKEGIEFKWVSQEVYQEVRNFLHSLAFHNGFGNIKTLDMGREFNNISELW